MTIQDFLDKRVRPCIGDALYKDTSNPQLQPPQRQMAKYNSEVLLDYLNEGVLDISRNSDMFVDTGYILLRVGMTDISLPPRYQGFYDTDDFSAGKANDFSSTHPLINIKVDRDGLKIDNPITSADINRYATALQGVDLPDDLIDKLVESNQIEPPAVPLLARDLLTDAIILSYRYRYLPKEYLLTDSIDNRELMYLLKWWTASNALYGDLHNEAVNLGNLYYQKYKIRLEEAGKSTNRLNSISVSPYNPTHQHY